MLRSTLCLSRLAFTSYQNGRCGVYFALEVDQMRFAHRASLWKRKGEYAGGCAAKLYQLCQQHNSKQQSYFETKEVPLSRNPVQNNKSDLLWNQPLKRDVEKGSKIFIVTEIYPLTLY